MDDGVKMVTMYGGRLQPLASCHLVTADVPEELLCKQTTLRTKLDSGMMFAGEATRLEEQCCEGHQAWLGRIMVVAS